ncbi:protein TRANSPARENT TESTA 12 [Pyrus ussuriensis x Pyrus communis]|uniref:Protein TRANSPARENT TESTA 12 n=1 Tax=Pyrus ussuriensis x Pyrus communis TaxID=2448454 RepID=A0A5N5H5C1_9ROSA|nr:protein TRANSPARENT TESTA 12 [Pyrus ussuriensis x Pyrus communis]
MALQLWETLKEAIVAYTGLSLTTFFTMLALLVAIYHVASGLFGSSDNHQRARSSEEEMQPLTPPVQLGEVTEEELKQYNGSDSNKPLLMAIKGQIRMLGVYMQRSWIILLMTACVLVPVYVWSSPIFELVGETTEISKAAGEFAVWMLPQLFAYALNFPIQKFLQAQRKVSVIAWISAAVLVEHAVFSWLLMIKLGWGLTGAAITLNAFDACKAALEKKIAKLSPATMVKIGEELQ